MFARCKSNAVIITFITAFILTVIYWVVHLNFLKKHDNDYIRTVSTAIAGALIGTFLAQFYAVISCMATSYQKGSQPVASL